jgi:hypothetical protein
VRTSYVGVLATLRYFFQGLELDPKNIRKTYPTLTLGFIERKRGHNGSVINGPSALGPKVGLEPITYSYSNPFSLLNWA